MQSSIRVRLLAGYAGVILLLILAWAAATVGTSVLRASYTHTVDVTDALTADVVTLEKLRDDEETGLRGYLLTLSPEFLQPYTAARQAIPELRRRTAALADSEPSLRPLLVTMG